MVSAISARALVGRGGADLLAGLALPGAQLVALGDERTPPRVQLQQTVEVDVGHPPAPQPWPHRVGVLPQQAEIDHGEREATPVGRGRGSHLVR